MNPMQLPTQKHMRGLKMNKIQQQAAQLDLWVGGDVFVYKPERGEMDLHFEDAQPRKPFGVAELRAMIDADSIILNMMGK